MARPPKIVDERIAQAEAAKVSSIAKRQEGSTARLAELMALTAKDRFAHLDDPALMLADRRALRRSIEQAVAPTWRMPRRLWRSGRLSRRLGRAVARTVLEPFVACSILVFAGVAGLAWHNTAHPVFLTQRLDYTIRVGTQTTDGWNDPGALEYLVSDWRGNAAIRFWFPGFGYARVPIAPDGYTAISEQALRAAAQAQQGRSVP